LTEGGQYSSRLRASKTPAPRELAAEIEAVFESYHRAKLEASTYLDAVMHPDEEWHGHARLNGWDHLSARQEEFIRICP
jgi:hypothetical protein